MAQSRRIAYFDCLKLFSVLGVICIHVTSPCYSCPLDAGSMLATYVVNAVGRSAVPIFLMISGALLLSRERVDILPFYRKVFLRYLIPTVAWVLVYKLSVFVGHGKDIYDFIYIVKTKNPGYHLWYMWMFVAVCVAYPFVHVIVSSPNRSILPAFLIVCAIYSFAVDPFAAFVNGNVMKVFNVLFSEYVFYFVLGYYLSEILRGSRRLLPWLFLAYVVSTLATGYMGYYFEQVRHVMPEYSSSPRSLTVCLQTICVFWMAKLAFRGVTQSRLLNAVSSAFFGIFFIHVLVLEMFDTKACAGFNGSALLIPYYAGLTIAVFVVSFGAVSLFRKIILVRYLFP